MKLAKEKTKKLVYALIGARGGSKGISRKNIVPVVGHPLIAYSIAAAKLTKGIDRVIVSTDDEEIAAIAKKYGAEVPFLRPAEISGDKSLDIEFFQHALDWFKENEDRTPDLIVHFRPTIPVREIPVIDKAISEMLADKDATALRSAEEVPPASIFKSFRIDNSYCDFFGKELFDPNEEFFNYPRQQLPKTYHVNGYVDIIRTESFLTSGLLYGKKQKVFLTELAPDIDEPADLLKVEEELKKPKYVAFQNFLV
ncbi:MAG: N-acylneuraminate cytidylyltransferase [Parcubacteria group bacterium Gr01-1014_73]|nr:MAG: N-acylneuraminate cytidylyltransferase [Parcubacteria group bacterium Gr01-1014_73]